MAQVPQNLQLPQGPLRESDVIESTPINESCRITTRGILQGLSLTGLPGSIFLIATVSPVCSSYSAEIFLCKDI